MATRPARFELFRGAELDRGLQRATGASARRLDARSPDGRHRVHCSPSTRQAALSASHDLLTTLTTRTMARPRLSATINPRRALALVALCLLLASPVDAKKKKAPAEPETRVRRPGRATNAHRRRKLPARSRRPCRCARTASMPVRLSSRWSRLTTQLMLTRICKVRLSAMELVSPTLRRSMVGLWRLGYRQYGQVSARSLGDADSPDTSV